MTSILGKIAFGGVALLAFATVSRTGSAADQPDPGLAMLQSEIQQLRQLLPSQSHAMADVGYHFANLWFAGRKKNWPLAQFNWEETRNHLEWAIKIVPRRKDALGNTLDLQPILADVEKGALQQIGDAIAAQDLTKFTAAYKAMLESCHACHVAAGKSYLRPHIPEQPAAPILDFTPLAD